MEPRSNIFFDPDEHPEDTLKAFEEFIKVFSLRYDAQYPDPPKVSLESAIQRWKVMNITEQNKAPTPSVEQYDKICIEWKEKDKVKKLLGMFSSHKLYEDWCIAEPNENVRLNAKWPEFVEAIKAYYRPTENQTLKHFHFRTVNQLPDESFPRFCSRVEAEAKHCRFKCDDQNCNAEETAIRDQILIGTTNNEIRDEALKQSWGLNDLRTEGMKMESAARSGAQISNEQILNKVGKYKFSNKTSQKKNVSITCYNCGNNISGSIIKHKAQCPAKTHTCNKCQRKGHYEKVCRSKSVNSMVTKEEEPINTEPNEDEVKDEDLYSVNLFRIKTSTDKSKPQLKNTKTSDFNVQVVVNNHLDRLVADTGAKISVCGTTQARKWGILDRMVHSKVKIKPYNSEPIPVFGEARCAVTFGRTSIPVNWHIISGSCEPILSGNAALQLGIIQFNKSADIIQPILMIEKENGENLQNILAKYPDNFNGLGKLKDYKVKLHCNPEMKPVNVPAHPFPYHLQERAQAAIDEMIKQGVIEEHPHDQPAPWVSNAVLAPKDDGSMRVTLDARNVNKALMSSNQPIPRQEDIKAKLAGAKVFSKMDLKSAYWQIELDENSRYLTVFHANGKLYRYNRLTMGLTPSQGELAVALRPIFANIKGIHVIHDDIIAATNTDQEHEQAIEEAMEALRKSGITLNPKKCIFGQSEISFWGMIFGSEGTKPDPQKVEALEYITAPTNKDELISFLCMMQSNAEFISNFAKKSSPLRELTKGRVHFKWESKHQQCYEELIKEFRKDTLMRFFDRSKRIFIFTDAHKTGLGAMLSQGDDMESAKPVAFASRTTNKAEANYPQLDLEAMGLDFALRRFRRYLVGAPDIVTLVTDHKPLLSIFNGNRKGSIRSEKIKMRHQDIRFEVKYQKGTLNQTDYISRRGKPIGKVPVKEQKEVNDLNNLLYALHTTPIIDHIGLANISRETSKDETLKQLIKIVKKGDRWIPKNCSPKLRKFKEILPEITITGNEILFKAERIILPESLQELAIQLSHRGSHPGQSGIERRLRSHFFFHNMKEKVEVFVQTCNDCMAFSNKKTSEPVHHHKVPDKCWDTVAVDLFGPMPDKNHVIVVQDLASRFPAAKLVSSTNNQQVVPALGEIYDNFGNPNTQLSDNGPPFNSKEMEVFAEKRDIELKKTPPLHPQANPAETFMKSLGKTMKIAHENKTSKKEALSTLLKNVRDTPQQATGLAPGAMMFRDGYRSTFPRVSATTEQVLKAQRRDKKQKEERESKINASKFRKETQINVGDIVILRNLNKKKKFDPHFTLEKYKVLEKSKDNTVIKVIRESDGMILRRHPDDIKVLRDPQQKKEKTVKKKLSEYEEIQLFNKQFEAIKSTEDEDLDINIFENRTPVAQDKDTQTEPAVVNSEAQDKVAETETTVVNPEAHDEDAETEATVVNSEAQDKDAENETIVNLRRSMRSKKANPKYLSQDFEN